MRTRILVTSCKSFEKVAFEAAAVDSPHLEWTFTSANLDEDTAGIALGYPIVCAFVTDRFNKGCLRHLHASGVRLLALRSAGFNYVDLDRARELGMVVVRVPKYSLEAVAEFMVGLYLSINRKIHRAHDRVRSGNYSLDNLVGHNVKGQTIGVVGTGNIGRCVVQIFKGFGAKVLATDLKRDSAWADSIGVQYADFSSLLEQSDVVTLNTSRGGLVDTDSLLNALKSKHLAGAALDVYEEEESVFFSDHSEDILSDDRLAVLNSLPNVLLTSHQAFLTYEALKQIAVTTIENVNSWIQRDPLKNSVL